MLFQHFSAPIRRRATPHAPFAEKDAAAAYHRRLHSGALPLRLFTDDSERAIPGHAARRRHAAAQRAAAAHARYKRDLMPPRGRCETAFYDPPPPRFCARRRSPRCQPARSVTRRRRRTVV